MTFHIAVITEAGYRQHWRRARCYKCGAKFEIGQKGITRSMGDKNFYMCETCYDKLFIG